MTERGNTRRRRRSREHCNHRHQQTRTEPKRGSTSCMMLINLYKRKTSFSHMCKLTHLKNGITCISILNDDVKWNSILKFKIYFYLNSSILMIVMWDSSSMKWLGRNRTKTGIKGKLIE